MDVIAIESADDEMPPSLGFGKAMTHRRNARGRDAAHRHLVVRVGAELKCVGCSKLALMKPPGQKDNAVASARCADVRHDAPGRTIIYS